MHARKAGLSLMATLALYGFGGSAAHADTTDRQLNKFINTIRPATAAAPAPGKTAAAAAAPAAAKPATALSLAQFELGLRVMPVTKVGHGSGASLSGAAASNPSPSTHGFCYEACKTARAVASCGTPDRLLQSPPEHRCDAVIDTPLIESIIGPSVGTGQSPFVDDQSGPDGVQPAGYTFLGQFVDHDVTRTQTDLSSAEELLARMQTDRGTQAQLAAVGITPDLVTQALTDAANPSSTSALSVNSSKLDLDSVYGVTDYAMLQQVSAPWFEQQNGQYTGRFAMRHVLAPTSSDAPLQIDGFDYERAADGSAEIPDPRNSEHKILAQIQGLFEQAHNDCVNKTLAGAASPTQTQIQLAFDACHNKVKWTYETIVATDFLPRISAEATLARVAPDALHHYVRGSEPTSVLPGAGGVHTFIYQCRYGEGKDAVIRIPHEFAVAGFRLGHSLVRDDYVLHQRVVDAGGDVLTGMPRPIFAASAQPSSTGLAGDNPLQPQDVIDWSYFFDTSTGTAQPVRPLDTLVSDKLFSLPVSAIPPGNGPGGKDTPSELNLPRRNVFRASKPTDTLSGSVGLANGDEEEAYALKRIPGLADTRAAVQEVLGRRLTGAGFAADSFGDKTPLWLYVLSEAEATQSSQNLGELGSHIVDEFLLGSLQCDSGSVLHAAPQQLKGWGPTETIAANRRYSFPELIAYLQGNLKVDGSPVTLTSR